ncbi:MAG: hypothetical protein HF982_12965 [Desulfobacteraceae bacterium]|nr:hypothetical protein [Desulfobacteraceae bacterium]MBC2720470.1 hypothetical protein [Desulfobacteraceae bacterium]
MIYYTGHSRNMRALVYFISIPILISIVVGSALASPTLYPTGTTIYKPEEVYTGYTIYVAKAKNQVLLIDMNGDIVHCWDGDGRFRMWYAEPLSTGKLVVATYNRVVAQ